MADTNIGSGADAVIVRRGFISAYAGSDEYILSPAYIDANAQIEIMDSKGPEGLDVNTISLIGGLTITGATVTNNTALLVLSNGAQVKIQGADSFIYMVGGDPLHELPGVSQSYTQFVQQTLNIAEELSETPIVSDEEIVIEDVPSDVTAPVVISQNIVDNAVDVTVNTPIELTFDDQISIETLTGIKLLDSTGAEVAITAAAAGDKLIITPEAALAHSASYDVVIEAGALVDDADNPFAGIALDALDFTTVAAVIVDDIDPAVVSQSIQDNATDVAVDAPIELTFDDQISIETPAGIKLLDSTGAEVAITAAAAGDKLIITPEAALAHSASYDVVIEAGALVDDADNPFAGIALDALDFTTIAAQSEINEVSLESLGGTVDNLKVLDADADAVSIDKYTDSSATASGTIISNFNPAEDFLVLDTTVIPEQVATGNAEHPFILSSEYAISYNGTDLTLISNVEGQASKIVLQGMSAYITGPVYDYISLEAAVGNHDFISFI